MKRRLALNSVISLLYQICAVVIGLIIPRIVLGAFGSEINGMLNSMKQMLSIITLLDLGVGAVVQASLYKPLLEKNQDRISEIYYSAKKYFTIIAWALIVYIVILCVYYGIYKTSEQFSWVFTTTLILSLSINYFAQYYFGISNTLLLNADQRIYVVTIVNLIGLVLNAVVTVVLIRLGSSVQMVQLASSMVFLLKPLALEIYVKNKYDIKKPNVISGDVLPEKWNGLIHHVATTITASVDTVILTLTSSFQLLSIYHVYVLPLNSIRNLIEVTSTSFKSFFGNIYASGDYEKLNNEFDSYETFMHYAVTTVFSTVSVTLVPFVLVYTNVVSDVNYKDELFCVFITLAYAIYSLRVTYTNMIFAAGRFKETQQHSLVEVALNIIVSIVLVFPLGLTGVAIGTAVSSCYRLIMSVKYLGVDVINRKGTVFAKKIIVDAACVTLVYIIARLFVVDIHSFSEWLIFAFGVFICSLLITTTLFSILLKDSFDIKKIIQRIKSRG